MINENLELINRIKKLESDYRSVAIDTSNASFLSAQVINNSLNKSKRVSFNEEWDISDSNYISDEKFSSLSTTFNLDEKFNTTIDFSQFSFDKTIKNKKRIVSRFFGKFMNIYDLLALRQQGHVSTF